MGKKWTHHPSVNENSGRLRLNVLEYLKADPTLPKHLVDGMVVLKNQKPMKLEDYIRGADGMSSYRRGSTGYKQAVPEEKWNERLMRWIGDQADKVKHLFGRKQVPPETFSLAADMIENKIISKDIGDMAEKVRVLIEKTKANGQYALARRLENEHKNIIYETTLVKNGLFHYLTEEDVINLLKTADRGIRIDFWNDYAEFVPDEVLEKKAKADSLGVFDNWCIMHYDPKGETLKQMKSEEWARDPILFGLVIGSDRLYYVADWKTKQDDLTIQKVCDTLGIKAIREAREYGAESDFGNFVMSSGGFDEEMTEPVPMRTDEG